ncbi:putative acyl-CoA dehydrogenase [Pseudomonas aeruginosa]|nr:putative acyl-CoA dehydrogenase [Pseudomonas aeruginosa]
MVLILPALSRPGHVRGFFMPGHGRRVAVAWWPPRRVRAHSPGQRESLGIPSKKTAAAPLQSAKSAG